MLSDKTRHEIELFLIYTVFLAILFSMFNIYERLLLSGCGGKTIPYGYAIIEAMILAKFILIGEYFQPKKKHYSTPLIIPVIIKSLVFTVAVLLFTLLEHIISGMLEAKDISTILTAFFNHRINIALAKCVVILFVFFLFFIILEISRVMGDKELMRLFFKTSKGE